MMNQTVPATITAIERTHSRVEVRLTADRHPEKIFTVAADISVRLPNGHIPGPGDRVRLTLDGGLPVEIVVDGYQVWKAKK